MPFDDLDQFLSGAGIYQPPQQEEQKDDLDSFLSSSGVYGESPQVDNLTPWQKARKLAEQAGATGAAPIPTGPGVLQGAKPDLGEIAGNLWSGAKSFVPGMVKMAGQMVEPLVNPGKQLMEQGMAQAAQAKAQETGVPAPEQPPTGAKAMFQNVLGLAEWGPRTLAEFVSNPVAKFNKDPFDVLVLATGGSGKEIKKWVKKAGTVDALTTADIQAAFNETLAKSKGAFPPEVAEAIKQVAEAPQRPVSPSSQAVEQLPQPQTPGGGYPPTGEPVSPQIRQPGPGEVRGLGIEFIDQKGRPITRPEAMNVKGRGTTEADFRKAIESVDSQTHLEATKKAMDMGRQLTGAELLDIHDGLMKKMAGIDPLLPRSEWFDAWKKSQEEPIVMGPHSGAGGWSPEALSRQKTIEFSIYDSRTKKSRPLIGVDAVDIQPGPFEIKIQKNKVTGQETVVSAGEKAGTYPQTRKPGPGEVRGLGIEFVNEKGEPISRTEAMAVKPKPTAGTPAPRPLQPEAVNQPPMVREFFDAIKAAKRLTPKQQNLYSIERKQRLAQAMQEGKKLGGRAGYEAQMKALSGSLERVQFETPKITQGHADALFQYIEDSPAVVGFDKIAAKNGLAKMLGEKGAGIPQPKELSLLKDVFGPEIATDIIGKEPWWKRIKDIGVDLLNVPRALVTSADLSFGLRQGVYYMARHPAKFWEEFPNQVKWFASDKAAKAVYENVRNRETYPLMREAGLDVIGAEEPFQSGIAEKIPIAGAVVKASSRAYTTFATKLRADSFDNLVNIARKAGRDPFADPKLAKDMAELVNTTTGRGDLGRLDRISKELNAAFFSPKLMASRLQTLNPRFYIKLDPLVRKEALTNLAAFAGYGATIVGLSKLAGLEVGVNPTSADFGKIKVGNTRIDLLGGYSQYVRIASQLITQKVTSTTSGKVIKLGEGYKPTTSMDVLLRGVEAKEAPVFSFATGLFKGQNWIGEKFNIGKEAANRFIPMVIQDFVDIYKDDPSLFPLGFLGVFGAGLQTYQPRRPRKMY